MTEDHLEHRGVNHPDEISSKEEVYKSCFSQSARRISKNPDTVIHSIRSKKVTCFAHRPMDERRIQKYRVRMLHYQYHLEDGLLFHEASECWLPFDSTGKGVSTTQ